MGKKEEKFDINKDTTNKFTNYSLSDYATKNVKCPNCGMFNPPTVDKCKKCKQDMPKQGK